MAVLSKHVVLTTAAVLVMKQSSAALENPISAETFQNDNFQSPSRGTIVLRNLIANAKVPATETCDNDDDDDDDDDDEGLNPRGRQLEVVIEAPISQKTWCEIYGFPLSNELQENVCKNEWRMKREYCKETMNISARSPECFYEWRKTFCVKEINKEHAKCKSFDINAIRNKPKAMWCEEYGFIDQLKDVCHNEWMIKRAYCKKNIDKHWKTLECDDEFRKFFCGKEKNKEHAKCKEEEFPPVESWIKDVTIISKPKDSLYNLILTDFVCHNNQREDIPKNYCPNLLPGTYLPDHDEKFEMMQVETARMFPAYFQKESIYVSNNLKYDSATPCGKAQDNPYYLSHNAMEHNRYYAVSRKTCGNSTLAHKTCPTDCTLFGGNVTNCHGRLHTFFDFPRPNPGDGFIESEGICSSLTGCMSNGHCGIFFNPERDFFAIGLYNNTGVGVTGWRSNKFPDKTYPLAMASHFDRNARHKRSHLELADGTNQTKDITTALMFQTVYYDAEKNNVANGYVVYQGKRHSMTNILSKDGEKWRGIYELKVADLPATCEPYYFYFELEDGTSLRLPEDPRYMYGTEGMNGCEENHYYDTNFKGTAIREFAANAGPSVNAPEFLTPGLTGTACEGCVKVSLIDAEKPGVLPIAT